MRGSQFPIFTNPADNPSDLATFLGNSVHASRVPSLQARDASTCRHAAPCGTIADDIGSMMIKSY